MYNGNDYLFTEIRKKTTSQLLEKFWFVENGLLFIIETATVILDFVFDVNAFRKLAQVFFLFLFFWWPFLFFWNDTAEKEHTPVWNCIPTHRILSPHHQPSTFNTLLGSQVTCCGTNGWLKPILFFQTKKLTGSQKYVHGRYQAKERSSCCCWCVILSR